ncbi:MAG: 50S ribosomal protein L6 [Patescibacteria group bacterium]
MSRIGKKIISVPAGVTVSYADNVLSAKGPKGELSMKVPPIVNLKQEGSEISFSIENENHIKSKALWGTTRANANNIITGVSEGFSKTLELNGVGYKMELGSKLTLYIGFSHPVVVEIPSEIKLELNKNTLSGTSCDKQKIGDFFTNIHDMKPCDVYKHKGFKFPDRFYRKKVGKKGKK